MKKFLHDIFKDNNDVNEKNFVGFMAFVVMVVFAVADIVTGFMGQHLPVQEFIYNSFLILVLGSFGISGVEKIFGNKNKQNSEEESIQE